MKKLLSELAFYGKIFMLILTMSLIVLKARANDHNDNITTVYGTFAVTGQVIKVEGKGVNVGSLFASGVHYNGTTIDLRTDGNNLFTIASVGGKVKVIYFNRSYFMQRGRLVAIY